MSAPADFFVTKSRSIRPPFFFFPRFLEFLLSKRSTGIDLSIRAYDSPVVWTRRWHIPAMAHRESRREVRPYPWAIEKDSIVLWELGCTAADRTHAESRHGRHGIVEVGETGGNWIVHVSHWRELHGKVIIFEMLDLRACFAGIGRLRFLGGVPLLRPRGIAPRNTTGSFS